MLRVVRALSDARWPYLGLAGAGGGLGVTQVVC